MRRFSAIATGTVAVGTVVAQQFSGALLKLPTIDPTQAFKLVSAVGMMFDSNGLGRIVAFSYNLNLILTNTASAQIRVAKAWASPVGGNGFLLGPQGMRVAAEGGEFVYGTDYAEVASALGGSPGQYLLQHGADLSNPGAGAPVTFTLLALVEIYQRRIPAS